jgi:hypothetical protein
MLNAAIPRDVSALSRVVRGLLAWVADQRIDGVADTDYHHVMIPSPFSTDALTISGLVQRPYLMKAGFQVQGDEGAGAGFVDWWGLTIDNGALLSRLELDGNYAALAVAENTLVPLKLNALRLQANGVAVGFSGQLANAYDSGPGMHYLGALLTVNPNGGIAGGNRYDCYFKNVAVCRENWFRVRNLVPGGSVRVSINGGATAVYNVDVGGRISFSFGNVLFPAKLTLELFTAAHALGRRYGYQIIRRAYGGDVYAGHSPSLPAVPSSAPIARGAWALSASHTWAGAGLNDAKDGNVNTRWTTGVVVDPLTEYFQIDTGAVQQLGAVTIDNQAFPADHPAAGDVLTSSNGIAWTPRESWTVANVDGAGMLTVTWNAIAARYVRLRATQTPTVPANWWSIGEVNLYPTVP